MICFSYGKIVFCGLKWCSFFIRDLFLIWYNFCYVWSKMLLLIYSWFVSHMVNFCYVWSKILFLFYSWFLRHMVKFCFQELKKNPFNWNYIPFLVMMCFHLLITVSYCMVTIFLFHLFWFHSISNRDFLHDDFYFVPLVIVTCSMMIFILFHLC